MTDEEEKELKKIKSNAWAYSNIDVQNYTEWSLDEYLEYHEKNYDMRIYDKEINKWLIINNLKKYEGK
tara:strand:- start:425 stop:628 length:204 start_codon:yes stop_codon:yes gene_type:complete